MCELVRVREILMLSCEKSGGEVEDSLGTQRKGTFAIGSHY
jgi:hypothetical protein